MATVQVLIAVEKHTTLELKIENMQIFILTPGLRKSGVIWFYVQLPQFLLFQTIIRIYKLSIYISVSELRYEGSLRSGFLLNT